MATYKKDKGVHVKSYTLDPDRTSPSAFEGNLYYNSSDGQFKYIGIGTGAWGSGGNLNTARDNMASIGVSNTAALAAGGSPGSKDNVEKYDGTSWTEVNEINTARTYAQGQFGTSTSGIISGNTNQVESWDGSSWTESTEINTSRSALGGAGASNTSGIVFGGDAGPAVAANTEYWNGSSWAEQGDLNTARKIFGSGGGTVYTAAIAAAGDAGPAASNSAEEWNGSAWAEISSVSTARYQNSGTTAGAPDSFLIFGGNPNRTITESWDGSSWTEVADLSGGRHSLGGAGSGTSAVAFGGNNPPPVTNATEEWTVTHAFKKVTTG